MSNQHRIHESPDGALWSQTRAHVRDVEAELANIRADMGNLARALGTALEYRAQSLVRACQTKVGRNPVRSLVIAASLGALVGLIVRR